jgi:oxygen-independent coproporphyrinogen-3 oxidase
LQEIGLATHFGWPEKVAAHSIFFGGGTPSLLPHAYLAKILARICDRFATRQTTEISIELNPESVSPASALELKALGFNRASLGVQSLQPLELQRLKRMHTPEGAARAFENLRQAGFSNISVDLMFGLEGQSVEAWLDTLDQVLAWKPEHISAYGLTIEKKTRFFSEQKLGRLSLPHEEVQVDMFREARRLLRSSGFVAYEISNYAQPGFESQHNLSYWEGRNYWGIGVSAHSFQRSKDFARRWWNPKSLPTYISRLESGLHIPETEDLSMDTHFRERLMTGLRLASGVNLMAISEELDRPIADEIATHVKRFIERGLIVEAGRFIRLTEKGILFSNEVFSAFFGPAEEAGDLSRPRL